MSSEPLTATAARELARAIVATGTVRFMAHAEERMAERAITIATCLIVLRYGEVGRIEERKGTVRYRFDWFGIGVPVIFQTPEALWVVTVEWLDEDALP